jgi:probable HAF family extracellular repeat protein
LDDLSGGENRSIGSAINSTGQVAGYSGATGGDRAFLWSPTTPNSTSGSMTNLGPPSAVFSVGNAINSQGQVVGNVAVTGQRAYLWTPSTPNGTSGSMVDIGDLVGGSGATSATGINSQGQVAGRSSAPSGGSHAFIWTPNSPNGTTGTMADLSDLPGGADDGSATGINARGQVVGNSNAATGNHAFLWTPTVPNGATGSMIDLNTVLESTSGSGWTLVSANSINDNGQIVGEGSYDPDGPGGVAAVTHAFLLTPVPSVPGDYNFNGIVDAGDYVTYRHALGHPADGLAADGNHNDVIDTGDYTVWRSNFGRPPGSSASAGLNAIGAVPEPTSLYFAAMGFVALAVRCSWHRRDK